MALGVAAQSVYVPFFAGIDDVPAPYKRSKLPAQRNSAYWIYKEAGVLVDSHYHDFLPDLQAVQKELNVNAVKMVAQTDAHLKELKTATERANYLTRQSINFATDALNAYRDLSLSLLTKMTDYSPLNFKTDENL